MTTTAMQGPEVPLLTPSQVAAIFGVKPPAIRKWANAGKLTVHRTLGGHRRYEQDEVRVLAAQRKIPAEATS